VGRRVELRVSQTEVAAVALDTGELVCRHARIFARHQTVTDPELTRRFLYNYQLMLPAWRITGPRQYLAALLNR
ncbi:MAG: hypothetical protein AAB250_15850, partial [Bdellovibrionota bacterium]